MKTKIEQFLKNWDEGNDCDDPDYPTRMEKDLKGVIKEHLLEFYEFLVCKGIIIETQPFDPTVWPNKFIEESF